MLTAGDQRRAGGLKGRSSTFQISCLPACLPAWGKYKGALWISNLVTLAITEVRRREWMWAEHQLLIAPFAASGSSLDFGNCRLKWNNLSFERDGVREGPISTPEQTAANPAWFTVIMQKRQHSHTHTLSVIDAHTKRRS